MNELQTWMRRTVIAAALGTMALASQATVVDPSTNNPLVFSWSFNTGSSLLTGNGSMSVSGFNSSLLSVAVTLNNTSLLGGNGGERLTSFGFGIDPNATAVSFVDAADGGMINATFAQGALPANVQGVEICAWGGNNCAGGANGGIFGGSSDSFTILLTGTWGTSVDIAPIGFKYQTGYGSFEFASSSTSSTSGGTSSTSSTSSTSTGSGTSGDIPEPGSSALVLMGLGLVAAGFRFRRRTPTTTAPAMA